MFLVVHFRNTYRVERRLVVQFEDGDLTVGRFDGVGDPRRALRPFPIVNSEMDHLAKQVHRSEFSAKQIATGPAEPFLEDGRVDLSKIRVET